MQTAAFTDKDGLDPHGGDAAVGGAEGDALVAEGALEHGGAAAGEAVAEIVGVVF